jgi:hypothetical protein
MLRSVIASLVLLAAGIAFAADDKDKPAALAGTWVRESNGLDLTIEFSGKDVLRMSAAHDENGVVVSCKYSEKGGLVKAKVTKIEIKGDFKAVPKDGQEFTFKWKVKGDAATLDDFTAEGLESAKPVIEGEYEKKKDKK